MIQDATEINPGMVGFTRVTLQKAMDYSLYHYWVLKDQHASRAVLSSLAVHGYEDDCCWVPDRHVVEDPLMVKKIGDYLLAMVKKKEMRL